VTDSDFACDDDHNHLVLVVSVVFGVPPRKNRNWPLADDETDPDRRLGDRGHYLVDLDHYPELGVNCDETIEWIGVGVNGIDLGRMVRPGYSDRSPRETGARISYRSICFEGVYLILALDPRL